MTIKWVNFASGSSFNRPLKWLLKCCRDLRKRAGIANCPHIIYWPPLGCDGCVAKLVQLILQFNITLFLAVTFQHCFCKRKLCNALGNISWKNQPDQGQIRIFKYIWTRGRLISLAVMCKANAKVMEIEHKLQILTSFKPIRQKR